MGSGPIFTNAGVRGRCCAFAAAAACFGWSGAAEAQSAFASYVYNDTAIVQPAIPEGFDRGRNRSVIESLDPNYQPLGIPVSSFNAYPKIDVAGGGTSNAFLAPSDDRRASAFSAVDPSLRLQSDWSRNALRLDGALDWQHYYGNSRRDQTNWQLGAKGDLEIGSNLTLTGQANGGRQFESPFSGGVTTQASVLSSFTSSFVSALATYKVGRIRLIAAGDHTTLDFSALDFGDGVTVSQRERNRDVTRGSGQFEYAVTPTLSAYVKATYSDISYHTPLADGRPNRSSAGYLAAAGVNIDIAGFARGTLAVGYIKRNFDSALYRSVSGATVEASAEFFPSVLTTVSVRVRRFLEDSSIGTNLPYFDNRVTLGVDHALLRNLILNASGAYSRIHYIGQNDDRDGYRLSLGGTYQATRSYGLRAGLNYYRQTAGNSAFGTNFTEVRGQIGFYVQR